MLALPLREENPADHRFCKRLEGQQIFRRERDDDALVWDFGRIDASQRDVVLALIARAMQLQQNRNDMLRTDGEDGRARELANSIAFAAAN